MANSPERIRVAILAFPEVTASTLYGMYDIFMGVGRDWGFLTDGEAGASLMEPAVVSTQRGSFTAANGVTIAPHYHLYAFPHPHVVCIPEIFLPPGSEWGGRFAAEIAYLRRVYAEGATIATVCSSAVLLAESGLLDGWDATTHWGYCDYLRDNYPSVRVHAQRALVASGDDQRLVMAGGGTTWLDLALLLIARWCGVEEAMRVARLNLIDWHSIGQQPFARLARSRQVEDAVIAECQVWIAEHYAVPGPVAQMARRSGLSDRSFKRRFQLATGMAPLQYVHTLRLEEAKQMLESGDLSLAAIAAEVGYEDPGFFSRLFRRQVGLTPAAYRKRFGGMRQALLLTGQANYGE